MHPSDANDHAPVVPVRRPGLDRVLLSGLQWEIVLHADGRRTPTDLAQLLGRSAYAVVLDVRRLAAAGLIEEPAAEPDVATPAPLPKRVPGAHTFDHPPAQARRTLPPGASAPAVLPGSIDTALDEPLLKRIRSALQALR